MIEKYCFLCYTEGKGGVVMDYTLAGRILPAYYRSNYDGEYRPLYGRWNSRLQQNHIEALHYHSCVEIGICLQGSGIVHVEDRIYPFSAGDVQIVPPGVPHLAAAAPDTETRWHWISIEAVRLLEETGFQNATMLQELVEHSFAGVFHPQEYPRLVEIVGKIQELLQTQVLYAREEAVFLVGQLLVECARVGRQTQYESRKRTHAGKLRPAIAYIRKHYPDKEAMREERIAESCNMSTSHFRALFKRETGMSVRDFIIQTRLARAAYLLRSTEMSVLNVALESGFGQASCFNRSFLRSFGQTPTEFRMRVRNG